jgi:hypothetical protein
VSPQYPAARYTRIQAGVGADQTTWSASGRQEWELGSKIQKRVGKEKKELESQ